MLNPICSIRKGTVSPVRAQMCSWWDRKPILDVYNYFSNSCSSHLISRVNISKMKWKELSPKTKWKPWVTIFFLFFLKIRTDFHFDLCIPIYSLICFLWFLSTYLFTVGSASFYLSLIFSVFFLGDTHWQLMGTPLLSYWSPNATACWVFNLCHHNKSPWCHAVLTLSSLRQRLPSSY